MLDDLSGHQEVDAAGEGTHYFYWAHDLPSGRRPRLAGGIFETLPVARREPAIFEEFFATPQAVDFSELAACHGVEHIKPTSWEEFEAVMAELPALSVRIVELAADRKRDVSMRADLLAQAGSAP